MSKQANKRRLKDALRERWDSAWAIASASYRVYAGDFGETGWLSAELSGRKYNVVIEAEPDEIHRYVYDKRGNLLYRDKWDRNKMRFIEED